ncbi:MAG: DNA polymerase III subunit beta [Gammaproteobacteria bacterium]|nr:MAG: DNA polymerase III subunit beta [Gammaproteobacteria bacterium]
MQLSIKREDLLKPLQQIIGAVERRQTMPALSNLLLRGGEQKLSITATDLEVELVATLDMEIEDQGATTIPARKLLDICRSLPDDSNIAINSSNEKIKVSSGRSRFSLATLPAEDFPTIGDLELDQNVVIKEGDFKTLIEKSAFAMAQQDVRYYLNGLLLELDAGQIRTVATDGHRLALSQLEHKSDIDGSRQIILPRKGVQELLRLLSQEDNEITVAIGKNHLRVNLANLQFTSKLIDGRFPEYQRVLPEECDNRAKVDKVLLKQALTRASILSNEKYKGIRLILDNNIMVIQAHNPEHEEAEDEIEIEYTGDRLEVGFNVVYLLDVLNALESDKVEVIIQDANSSALIVSPGSQASRYVVMPMRL